MQTTPDGKEIIPGCEPWSASGGPHGALVLHGFTGNPQSLRGLAEALHGAGYTVELPLLPGHGTSVDDMIDTGWADWSAAAEAAYEALAARVDKVVVAGLSMGGALARLAGGTPPRDRWAWSASIPPWRSTPRWSTGSARWSTAVSTASPPSAVTWPTRPSGRRRTTPRLCARCSASPTPPPSTVDDLAKITCPVLLLTSPQDHVVDPANSDILAERVSGPVERISLERSYHVATLDYDKDLIFERAVEFAGRVTGPG